MLWGTRGSVGWRAVAGFGQTHSLWYVSQYTGGFDQGSVACAAHITHPTIKHGPGQLRRLVYTGSACHVLDPVLDPVTLAYVPVQVCMCTVRVGNHCMFDHSRRQVSEVRCATGR